MKHIVSQNNISIYQYISFSYNPPEYLDSHVSQQWSICVTVSYFSKTHAKHFLVETEGEVGDSDIGDESSGLNRLAHFATGLDEKGKKWTSLCRCEDGCEIINGPNGCECRNTDKNQDCDFLPLWGWTGRMRLQEYGPESKLRTERDRRKVAEKNLSGSKSHLCPILGPFRPPRGWYSLCIYGQYMITMKDYNKQIS